MGEKEDITFGDFSQTESNEIRNLSITIQNQFEAQRSRSNHHFLDAFALSDLQPPTQFRANMNRYDEIELKLHPSDDEMFTDDNLNISNNTDPNEAHQSTERQAERYHSIPHVDNLQAKEVIPETPKEQRVKKQMKVTRFMEPRTTASEGNVNRNISLERSDSQREILESNPTLGNELADELMNASSDETIDEPSSDLLLRGRNSHQNFKRFSDKMSQTSKHQRDAMTSVTDINRPNPVGHMEHMVNDIRNTNFGTTPFREPYARNSFNRPMPQTSTAPTPAPLDRSVNNADMSMQRMEVNIYRPAIQNWRNLCQLQGKRVQLELRIAFNERLLGNDMFPSWAVSFNPPENLLLTQRAIELTVGFRYEEAKNSIRMINDLMREESERLTHEITATMASLEVHYHQPEAADFHLDEALDALTTFMNRTRDQEQSELTRRFNAIASAPLAALWKNLPAGTQLPPGAIRAPTQPPETTPPVFQGPSRGTRRPAWRGGRGGPSRGIWGRGGRGRANN